MHNDPDAQHHDHEHQHGHENDRGFSGLLRYLRSAPRMWRSAINQAVVDLAAPVAGEHALDIGAGMGPGVIRAAKAGAAVVAVEPMPYMRRILSARRLFQRARSRITVTDGAAESLPVPDNSIDVMWAVNTMHHWTNPEAAAGEIRRALGAGGRVVLVDEEFSDAAHPDFARFGSKHTDGEDHENSHHGFTMVDAVEMGELLKSAGLVDIDAGKRTLLERPSIVVTARASPEYRRN